MIGMAKKRENMLAKKKILWIILALVIIAVVIVIVSTGKSNNQQITSGNTNIAPNVPLKILSSNLTYTNSVNIAVLGMANNTGAALLRYVQINAMFYDKSGNFLGNSSATTSNLHPGEVWKFMIPYLRTDVNDVDHYSLNATSIS